MTSDDITTTPAPGPANPICPDCGAEVRGPNATRCWLCHEPLSGRQAARDAELLRRIRKPALEADSPAWAVIAVLIMLLFGGLLFSDAYGVVVVLLIAAVPALVRTVVMASRRREAGAPADSGSVLVTFLTSLGVVFVVGLASGIAFFATCFVVCLGMLSTRGHQGPAGEQFILVTSVGLGLIPGLVLFFFLMRRLWPRKV